MERPGTGWVVLSSNEITRVTAGLEMEQETERQDQSLRKGMISPGDLRKTGMRWWVQTLPESGDKVSEDNIREHGRCHPQL